MSTSTDPPRPGSTSLEKTFDFHSSHLQVRPWPALCALALATSAQGAAPQVKTQAPGFYRMMLGDFEVTALFDGVLDFNPKELLTHTTPRRSR